MKNKVLRKQDLRKILALVVAIMLFMVTIFGVMRYVFNQNLSQMKPSSDTKLSAVTTIFPVAELTQAVLGDLGVVTQLVPNSTDPHTYSPTSQDIINVNQARFFVYLGDKQEPWVRSLLASIENPDLKIIDLSQVNYDADHDKANADQSTVESSDTNHNSEHDDEFHFWLDFKMTEEALRILKNEIIQVIPEYTHVVSENTSNEQSQWQDLANAYELGLANCQTRTVIYAGHSAFGHLAEEYRLDVIDGLSASPDSEIAPQTLANMIDLLNDNQSLAVFTDVFFSAELAETIASETGLPVLKLNPGDRADLSGNQSNTSLISILWSNLSNLEAGLGCQKP